MSFTYFWFFLFTYYSTILRCTICLYLLISYYLEFHVTQKCPNNNQINPTHCDHKKSLDYCCVLSVCYVVSKICTVLSIIFIIQNISLIFITYIQSYSHIPILKNCLYAILDTFSVNIIFFYPVYFLIDKLFHTYVHFVPLSWNKWKCNLRYIDWHIELYGK